MGQPLWQPAYLDGIAVVEGEAPQDQAFGFGWHQSHPMNCSRTHFAAAALTWLCCCALSWPMVLSIMRRACSSLLSAEILSHMAAWTRSTGTPMPLAYTMARWNCAKA